MGAALFASFTVYVAVILFGSLYLSVSRSASANRALLPWYFAASHSAFVAFVATMEFGWLVTAGAALVVSGVGLYNYSRTQVCRVCGKVISQQAVQESAVTCPRCGAKLGRPD